MSPIKTAIVPLHLLSLLATSEWEEIEANDKTAIQCNAPTIDPIPIKKLLETRQCEACNVVYRPKVLHQKYCSIACQVEEKRKRLHTFNCEVCRKPFESHLKRVTCGSAQCIKIAKKGKHL